MQIHLSAPEHRRMDPAAPGYQIRINGHIGPTLLSAFPAMTWKRQGSHTVLTGVLDRAALYGVLAEIETLGLDLLEVSQLTPETRRPPRRQRKSPEPGDHPVTTMAPSVSGTSSCKRRYRLMTSARFRDQIADHFITPQNSAFLFIDYQPAQLAAVRSMDHELLVRNAVSTVRTIKTFEVPVVHSTVNVAAGQGPTLPELAGLLTEDKPLDRTTVNSWEDVEFLEAVRGTGRRKLIICALWTEVCMAFTALDALHDGYEVYPVVDAIGGTSPEAHRAGLDRVVQAGGQLVSWVSLACELQRDWARQETVPAIIEIVLTDRLLKE
jgi:nicotinamidase-related amidase